MIKNPSLKICFVSPGSYPLLASSETLKYVGGAELKQVLIGSELVKRGRDISFITYNEEHNKNIINNIKIIRIFSVTDNGSSLKKALTIWKALKKAKADVYIKASGPEGIVPYFCFFHRKKYVKWLTSDRNAELKYVHGEISLISKINAYLDIIFAHLIIAQNEYQKVTIEKNFKKNCIILPNPAVLPEKKLRENNNLVLWVGTIRNVKQPELYLKIARSLHNIKFMMIGSVSFDEKDLFEKIMEEAKKIPNLEFIHFVPHHKIFEFYQKASILVNTSKVEGFPNTFLEAWANYTPVISLNANPNGVIDKGEFGFHSKTIEKLISDVERLILDNDLREKMAENARRYVEKNHNLEVVADRFEDMLNSLND